MSCLQIWNIEQEKDTQKEKVGDRDLERERKTNETFFCWKNNMKIL